MFKDTIRLITKTARATSMSQFSKFSYVYMKKPPFPGLVVDGKFVGIAEQIRKIVIIMENMNLMQI